MVKRAHNMVRTPAIHPPERLDMNAPLSSVRVSYPFDFCLLFFYCKPDGLDKPKFLGKISETVHRHDQ